MAITFGNIASKALSNKIQGPKPLNYPAKNVSNPFLNTPAKTTPNPNLPTPNWKNTLDSVQKFSPVQPSSSMPNVKAGGMSTTKPVVPSMVNPVSKPTVTPSSTYQEPTTTDTPSYTPPTPTNIGPTSNNSTAGNSPYLSSLNTMQNYAQGTGNSGVNTAIGGIQGIANNGSARSTEASNRLMDISKNQTPEVVNRNADYNKFVQENPYMLAAQHNPNVAASIAAGRTSLLGQTFAQEAAAKQAGVTNALSGQSQQIGAANESGDQALATQAQQLAAGQAAGGLAQGQQNAQQAAAQGVANLASPVANASFFGSPTTGNTVGNSTGGTGNTLIDNAVGNAVQQIKNGSSTQDAMATLSQFGPIGQQALISQMQKFDPNWSITASNAIAQQNMTQGQEFQGEANRLSTTLKQLDTIEPVLDDFLKRSGLNDQEQPFYNKAIKEYASQLKNPADVASLNAMMADVKTYTAQILGSSGLNPTEVSATVNSFDPSNLNGKQLKAWMTNLKNLGQSRLQPLQQSASNSYGSGNPVMGNAANPTTTSTLAPQNSPSALNTDNPIYQGLIGGGMQSPGLIKNLVGGIASGIASKIFK